MRQIKKYHKDSTGGVGTGAKKQKSKTCQNHVFGVNSSGNFLIW
jgi:hypothetical protein